MNSSNSLLIPDGRMDQSSFGLVDEDLYLSNSFEYPHYLKPGFLEVGQDLTRRKSLSNKLHKWKIVQVFKRTFEELEKFNKKIVEEEALAELRDFDCEKIMKSNEMVPKHVPDFTFTTSNSNELLSSKLEKLDESIEFQPQDFSNISIVPDFSEILPKKNSNSISKLPDFSTPLILDR